MAFGTNEVEKTNDSALLVRKTNDHADTHLGELRDMILSMLDTYTYETNIYHIHTTILGFVKDCSIFHHQLNRTRTITSAPFRGKFVVCWLPFAVGLDKQ